MAFQGGLSDSVALLVQQEYCQSVAFGADCQRFSCRIWLLKGDGYQCLCFAGAGARCCPLFKIWIKPARPGSIASAGGVPATIVASWSAYSRPCLSESPEYCPGGFQDRKSTRLNSSN